MRQYDTGQPFFSCWVLVRVSGGGRERERHIPGCYTALCSWTGWGRREAEGEETHWRSVGVGFLVVWRHFLQNSRRILQEELRFLPMVLDFTATISLAHVLRKQRDKQLASFPNIQSSQHMTRYTHFQFYMCLYINVHKVPHPTVPEI